MSYPNFLLPEFERLLRPKNIIIKGGDNIGKAKR